MQLVLCDTKFCGLNPAYCRDMRKTNKKSQLTLSAEKLREMQTAREVTAANLANVAGGKVFCAGSSFGCIDTFCCGMG